MTDVLPAQPPISLPRLRPVQHPDMSAFVTHFCDRTRPQYVPRDIGALDGPGRVDSILWQSQLRAFISHSGGDPVVCFTEATIKGLEFLIGDRSYQPWGLVFDRQSVYDAGGGPVWYARADEYYKIRDAGSRVQAWSVRLEAGSSDWLEEREWRIPTDPQVIHVANPTLTPPAVPLTSLNLIALLVGDPSWSPVRQDWARSFAGAMEHRLVLPAYLAGIPRWCWNPATRHLEQLPPLL